MFTCDDCKCCICGKIGYWKCTLALLSEPPIEIEYTCPDCIKACSDAKEQKKYLRTQNY